MQYFKKVECTTLVAAENTDSGSAVQSLNPSSTQGNSEPSLNLSSEEPINEEPRTEEPINGCVIGPQQVGDSSMDPLLEVANASRNQVWYSRVETVFTDEGMEKREHML